MYSVLVNEQGDELDHILTPDRYMVRAGLEWLKTTVPAPDSYVITNKIWERIKEIRDDRQYTGVKVTVSGVDYWFHSDDTSRLKHMGLAMMGVNMPAGIEWKTMSGAMVPMTPQLANQIFMAVAVLDQTIFAMAEYHRAHSVLAVDPCTYDYVSGWPLAFGG